MTPSTTARTRSTASTSLFLAWCRSCVRAPVGSGPERRILLLHGPVGSSKSTIVRIIKRGLEAYTKTADGAIYTFSWDVDGETIPSPMNQDPLLLMPESSRREVEQRLTKALKREYAIRIEGELDPVSRYYYQLLMKRYDGEWGKVMQHVRVRRFCFSEKDRTGIGTFQPKDEKNQDSTELTGDLNYRKIAEFGSDSDPRAFNFDGEFNIANRGLLEFVEVLKLDVAFLYDLLGATQEHSIKPKKFQQTSIDEVIIGHTNEPEYKRLQNNELMEAFRDRTIKIDVPYNLSVSGEVEIYRRRYGDRNKPGRGLSPHTLEVASLWAVLTRLEDPTHPNLTMLQKARLYDGTEVAGFTQEQVKEMHERAEREGMIGISPRFVQDCIAACIVSGRATVTPRHVIGIDRGRTLAPLDGLGGRRASALPRADRGGARRVRRDHQARSAGRDRGRPRGDRPAVLEVPRQRARLHHARKGSRARWAIARSRRAIDAFDRREDRHPGIP